jgi:hypothetical protein
MPIHDWTRVDAGVFHHFHQRWIGAITDVLNQRLLPREYYALAEQQGAGFEPDVLTLKASEGTTNDDDGLQPAATNRSNLGGGNGHAARVTLAAEPPVRFTAETDLEFYRRKQNVVAVRLASGDHLVAIVEIVSRGNKSGRRAFDDFIRKASDFLTRQVHLLILDLQPPTAREPHWIDGAIWDEVAGQPYLRPADKPLTLASYESGGKIRAFVEPVDFGDALIDMPLYLEPGRYVALPLEETYQLAYESVPLRWRKILDPG